MGTAALKHSSRPCSFQPGVSALADLQSPKPHILTPPPAAPPCPPPRPCSSSNTTGLWAVALAVPSAWNTLPPDFGTTGSLISFKYFPNVTFSVSPTLTILFKIATALLPQLPVSLPLLYIFHKIYCLLTHLLWFLLLFKFLFIYFIFWLPWVFLAVGRLSLVVSSRGYSSLRCTGFSLWWLLLLQSMGSRRTGFSSCGSRAQ